MESLERSLDLRDKTVRLLETLNENERAVILAYYGEGLTLREIGERLDRSIERVRQYQWKAVRKIGRQHFRLGYGKIPGVYL